MQLPVVEEPDLDSTEDNTIGDTAKRQKKYDEEQKQADDEYDQSIYGRLGRAIKHSYLKYKKDSDEEEEKNQADVLSPSKVTEKKKKTQDGKKTPQELKAERQASL